MSDSTKNHKLNNGLTIPILGLGTTTIMGIGPGGILGNTGKKDMEEIVYNSIKNGTRLIDTASKYNSEEEIGRGVKRAINEGIIKREDLFIITKMWPNEKEDPEKALKNSLSRLQLDYIDLYLDHWPSSKCYNGKDNFKLISIKDLWPKMEKLVEQGLAKSIGVSNYNVQNLLVVLSICKIKPVVDEVEFHPYLYQKDLKEFCDKEDIKIVAYYPLIKGVNFRTRYEKIMKEKNMDLLNEEIVKNLSKKYGKTVGQIILNWHLHLGVIPITGTFNPERMKENLSAANFTMEENDIKALCSFSDKQYRFCDGVGIFGINIFA
jgi:diketogulonate reductase-like aldo/keto reductase